MSLKRVVMTVLLLSGAALAAAGLSVSKVFEGEGIPKFNRWVSSNAKDYPGITPARISVEKHESAQDDTAVKCEVHFWNDDGTIRKTVKVAGRASVDLYPDGDKVGITEPDDRARPRRQSLAVLNSVGEDILKVDTGYSDFSLLGANSPLLYQVPLGGELQVLGDELVVFDGRGHEVSRIRDPAAAWLSSRVAWSRDTTCVLELGLTTPDVIVITVSGRILWRKKFNEHVQKAISDDGTRIAVLCRETLHVYDRSGNKVASHNTGFPRGTIALSTDGDRVAASFRGVTYLFSNAEKRLLWKATWPASGPPGTPVQLRVVDDMVVAVHTSVYFLGGVDGSNLCEPLDLNSGATTPGPLKGPGGHVRMGNVPKYDRVSYVSENALLVESDTKRTVYQLRRVQ